MPPDAGPPDAGPHEARGHGTGAPEAGPREAESRPWLSAARDQTIPPAVTARREPPRRMGVLLGVAAIVLLADSVSKAIVVTTLSGHPPVRVLDGLLKLRVLRNSGAAFNIGTGMTVVFTAIAVGVIVFILRTARRLRSLPWAVTLGLLLGGACGNLADRLLRGPSPLSGYVIDWIQLPHWPVFNLADSSIVCGGAIAVLLSILGIRVDGTKETATEADESRSTPHG